MPASTEVEYGTCPCGGSFENHWVEVRMNVSGRDIVLPGVAQGVCLTCSGRVYKAEVLACIECVMRGEGAAEPC